MSEQWYLHRQGDRYGPYSWDQLKSFAADGQLAEQDLVWGEGMADWIRAAEVEGLFGAGPPAAPSGNTAQSPDAPGGGKSTPPGEGERVAGYIPALRRKTGLFSSKMYTLVLTDRRTIFAELTAEMLKQAAADAIRESKEQGKGFLARTADTMKSQQRVYERYLNYNPEEILSETPGNFFLDHAAIRGIKYRVGFNHDDNGRAEDDTMTINTDREKIKLLSQGLRVKEIKRLYAAVGVSS